MKKICKVLIVITAMLFTMGSDSCPNGSGDGNPKRLIREAAYNYLDAMGNYRVEDAVPYCTTETQNGIIRISRNLVKAVEPGYIESDTPAKIKIKKVELTSDTTATVQFRKTTPIKKQTGEVNLVFRDGQWKVHILMGPKQKQEGTANEN